MALNPFTNDDPFRVAQPYQVPGEIEPKEPRYIPEAEAFAEVMAALSRDQDAYGMTAEQWIEELTNQFYPQLKELVLAAADPERFAQAAYNTRRRIAGLCADVANGDI